MLIALAVSQPPRSLPPGERALAAALPAESAVWSDPAVRWTGFDAVIIRSCWDYHLRLPEFLAWLDALEAAGVPVLNAPPLIRWNANKLYLGDLARRGIGVPQTVWLAEGEEADVAALCRRHGWQAAVVKPLVSASAHQTELRTEGAVAGPRIIQRYLPEIRSRGEWSLLFFGGAFSHAVVKRPGGDDFRVQEEHGGRTEPGTPPAAVGAFARHVIETVPGPAFARVDIVERDEGPVLMELELIEPELFLHVAAGAPQRLAQAIRAALPAGRRRS